MKEENIMENLYMFFRDTLQEEDATIASIILEEAMIMWHH